MERDGAEEFTAALEQTLSGSWRLTLLAVREGVPAALGLSVEQWQARVGGYVRLSIPERREAVRELVEDEHLSQRETAKVLGVAESTVRADRAQDRAPEVTAPQVNGTPTAQDRAPVEDDDAIRRRQSQDLARALFTLAARAERIDAVDHEANRWHPDGDIYPVHITADVLHRVAMFLDELSERWPS